MYDSLNKVIDEIKNIFTSKNILVVFAYNGTGKTRITRILEEDKNIDCENMQVLSYSSFFTDAMSWNEGQNFLKFNNEPDILTIAKDEGLDIQIINTFENLTQEKIMSLVDLNSNEFRFKSKENNEFVKISKGEEDIFYWSWFNSILENMYDNLIENEENRSVHRYDKIKYVIIDDPVSSLDESKIITLAVKISEYVKRCEDRNLNIKFIITTHHTLFYNVILNELKCVKKSTFYELENVQDGYLFEKQNNPVTYHLYIKGIIDNAIKNNEIDKYHFNMFRNLLEKTAIYFGYKNWKECIAGINEEDEVIRIINNFSHNDVDGVEYRTLPKEHKDIFISTYNDFIKKFNFNND